MVNPHLEDGQVFVEGRSEETARKLIEAADAAKIDRSEILTTSDGYIVPEKLSGDFETKSASDYPAVPTEPGTTTDPNEATNVGGLDQDPEEQTRRANEAAERQASNEPDEPTAKEAQYDVDDSTRLNTTDSDRPTVSEGGVNPDDEGDTARDGTVRQSTGGASDPAEADTPPTPRSVAEAEGARATEADTAEEDQFDPADHNVDEVWEHLESADDAERKRVLAAERKGKDRKAFHTETEGDK